MQDRVYFISIYWTTKIWQYTTKLFASFSQWYGVVSIFNVYTTYHLTFRNTQDAENITHQGDGGIPPQILVFGNLKSTTGCLSLVSL